MRWRSFCAEILGAGRELGVEMVVTLGALLADTPHTRPVPVSGTRHRPRAAAARWSWRRPGTRARPASSASCRPPAARSGIPAVSIWAAVPHYVAQPPCPKATLALLRKVEDLLDLAVPLGELPEEARAWERGVDELAAEDEEVAEYVRALEQARGHRRPAGGQRRGHRPGVRAVPAPPRRRRARARPRDRRTGDVRRTTA